MVNNITHNQASGLGYIISLKKKTALVCQTLSHWFRHPIIFTTFEQILSFNWKVDKTTFFLIIIKLIRVFKFLKKKLKNIFSWGIAVKMKVSNLLKFRNQALICYGLENKF
jgi:hypothetical protein